ncbi:hypothetical protein [Telluribacter humicola]|uniref:hypothetical protein n=1 Tax=Telluribacter humicola TaxID=1720261 RepID=UPI001A95BF89|nr:hypothetical protein [Telluribacter humicola]
MSISKIKITLPLLLAVLYIIFFFSFIYSYAENAPFIDDYNGLFDFLIAYLNADTLERKFHFLIRQHNEHRIAFPRLVTLLYYYIVGEVNLKYLILLSSLNLVLLWGVLAKVMYSIKRDLVALIPMVLLLFHFQHYDNIFWAECSLQNLSVACLGVASVWLSVQPGFAHRLFGLVLAVLTTFSSGSGLAIWVVLCLVFILEAQWKRLLTTVVVGGVSLLFYLRDLELTTVNEPFSIYKRIDDVFGTFGLLGSWIDFREESTNPLAIVAGMLSCAIILYPILRKLWSQRRLDPISLFILGSLLYIGATAFIINFGRDAYTESRYKIYASIALLLTYISLYKIVPHTKKNYLKLTSLALAVIYCGFTTWRYIPEVDKRRHSVLADLQTILSNQQTVRTKPFAYRIEILQKLKAWQPPVEVLRQEFDWSQQDEHLKSSNVVINEQGDLISVSYEELVRNQAYYLYAVSKNFVFFFPIYRQRNSLLDFLKTGQLYSLRKEQKILKQWLVEGTYQIGIYDPVKKKHAMAYHPAIHVTETATAWLPERLFNDHLPM